MTERLEFNFPFTKVDKTKRLVTGIATADNIDQSGDLVPVEASKDAFAKWMGNIREMHSPKAVGRAVSFQETPVSFGGKTYNGVEVTAYISKGAEDTWQKVLDGTLTGWSIGGNLLQKAFRFDEETNRTIRIIQKYRLDELSLVDNPDNPAAKLTIVKMASDGTLEYDLGVHGIYYCDNDMIALVDEPSCSECGKDMSKIGSVDDVDLEAISKMIRSYRLNKSANDLQKGVNDMNDLQNNESDDNVKDVDITQEEKVSFFVKMAEKIFGTDTKTETASATSAPVTININGSTVEQVEKSASTETEVEVTEVTETDDEKVEKSVDDNGGNEVDQDELLKSLSALIDGKLEDLKKDITASVDEKVEALEKSVSDVTEKVETTTTAATELADKVEEFENKGALKKSVDDDNSDDDEDDTKIEKSAGIWGNVFLPQPLITALGYES